MKVLEVLGIKKYDGYELITELVQTGAEEAVKLCSAFTPDGHYIGNHKMAHQLVTERGIAPEPRPNAPGLRGSGTKSCSIGFCESEQKWYGWSHRAIWGFSIGSKVKLGDAAYVENDLDVIVANAEKIFREDFFRNVKISKEDDGVRVEYEEATFEVVAGAQDNGTAQIATGEPIWESGSMFFRAGHGQWIASSLDDARQMAIDFAEAVA